MFADVSTGHCTWNTEKLPVLLGASGRSTSQGPNSVLPRSLPATVFSAAVHSNGLFFCLGGDDTLSVGGLTEPTLLPEPAQELDNTHAAAEGREPEKQGVEPPPAILPGLRIRRKNSTEERKANHTRQHTRVGGVARWKRTAGN